MIMFLFGKRKRPAYYQEKVQQLQEEVWLLKAESEMLHKRLTVSEARTEHLRGVLNA
jgi:hypothetical protein